MRDRNVATLALAVLALTAGVARADATPEQSAAVPPTTAEVIANSTSTDWRKPAPADTLYLDLPTGRVVIELANRFAPEHVANIRVLAKEGYWDGLAILRSQENYVVQWGDPNAGDDPDAARGADAERARAFKTAKKKLPAEFDRASTDLAFTALKDGDIYAPQTGWSGGFPAARDPKTGRAWLAHCNAMVGAGRDNAADSSNGAELYVVIGHAPRHLDRNITVVGRVLQGMELLSVLPRGTGALGFYEKPEQRMPITAIKLASDVPEEERVAIEVFRTDTPAFDRLVESRRNRREEWFIDPVGRVELCNVPIPVRAIPAD